jgi:hypothetical protein
MKSYMDMDPEGFDKLTTQAQNDDKIKIQRVKDMENKWAKLEQKFGKE